MRIHNTGPDVQIQCILYGKGANSWLRIAHCCKKAKNLHEYGPYRLGKYFFKSIRKNCNNKVLLNTYFIAQKTSNTSAIN